MRIPCDSFLRCIHHDCTITHAVILHIKYCVLEFEFIFVLRCNRQTYNFLKEQQITILLLDLQITLEKHTRYFDEQMTMRVKCLRDKVLL
jgi:hypothetical protein